MPTILAIDTASSTCSVALWCDGGIRLEHTRNVTRAHNQALLPMVDALFGEADVDRGQVELVAFGAGPGSFTGVRIAAAASQGIALGCGANIVAVPSARALAHSAIHRASAQEASAHKASAQEASAHKASAQEASAHEASAQEASAHQTLAEPGKSGILTITRSRRDAYYYTGFIIDGQDLNEVLACALHEGPIDLPAVVTEDWIAVGDRPDWLDASIRFDPAPKATAADIAALALSAWQRGEVQDVALGLPLYVSGDSPWQPTTGSS